MKVFASLSVLLVFVFQLACFAFGGWVVGSLLSSLVKAAQDQCSMEYGIENYGVDGNFFCPSSKLFDP